MSYLETNPGEDNSSLGNVSIKASFDHLTWDGLETELEGEPQITLQLYDGIMGQVQVEYNVWVTDSTGNRSLVRTEDNFTMKWNDKRIYLMNYNRYANEMFNGDRRILREKGSSGDFGRKADQGAEKRKFPVYPVSCKWKSVAL